MNGGYQDLKLNVLVVQSLNYILKNQIIAIRKYWKLEPTVLCLPTRKVESQVAGINFVRCQYCWLCLIIISLWTSSFIQCCISQIVDLSLEYTLLKYYFQVSLPVTMLDISYVIMRVFYLWYPFSLLSSLLPFCAVYEDGRWLPSWVQYRSIINKIILNKLFVHLC